MLIALLKVATGCMQPPIVSTCCPEAGVVVMLPGVEGSGWQLTGMVKGLQEAGLDRRIDIIAWGKYPFGSLDNLMNIKANRCRAREIATRITEHHSANPEAPITLLGYSGGGGIAILTAEALPEDVEVDRIILIAAALAPEYDLSRALPRCHFGLVSFYSPRDRFFLGIGTSLFGTIDRKNTDSAGRVGFLDADGQLQTSPKIEQIEWTSEWLKLGHWGGHLGWLARDWARDILAPKIDPSLKQSDVSSHD